MIRFLRDQRGATAIEYAVIASLICVAIVAAVGSIAGPLNTTFTQAAASLR